MKDLQRIFPVDDSMVIVIDDRLDVWGATSNVIRIEPCNYFSRSLSLSLFCFLLLWLYFWLVLVSLLVLFLLLYFLILDIALLIAIPCSLTFCYSPVFCRR